MFHVISSYYQLYVLSNLKIDRYLPCIYLYRKYFKHIPALISKCITYHVADNNYGIRSSTRD